MFNTTTIRGICPAPFYEAQLFTGGGYVDGRLCENILGVSCCAPCPLTYWAYPDNFRTIVTATNWVAVVSVCCCTFLLASWAVLPVEKTSRHYLTICLSIATMLLSLGFAIPLAAKPDQCYDAITPHGMSSSSVCATTGSLVILGFWSIVFWVFLRSVSLNLQICWQVVVGRNFMWAAQLVGWGVPAFGLVMALVFSGVSFRFGTTCHINHGDNSLANLWIPLLVFSSLTLLIQLTTFAYSIKVYLSSLSDNVEAIVMDTNPPSYTPCQAYRRVRSVIQLQWRGITLMLIIVFEVIFFAIVFGFLDDAVQRVEDDRSAANDWINCLQLNPDNKDACLGEARTLVFNEGTVGSVLTLLSMDGIILMLLTGRCSMVTAWYELLTMKMGAKSGRPADPRVEFDSPDSQLDESHDECLNPSLDDVHTDLSRPQGVSTTDL